MIGMIRMNSIRLALLAVFAALIASVAIPAGAKGPGRSDIKALIANAETKAEHERIAQYFDAEAARYEAQAREHAEFAAAYEKSTPGAKYPGSMQTFQHCDDLSKSLQKAADDARALAVEHRTMAKEAKK